jgi:oligoendopeptidase F
MITKELKAPQPRQRTYLPADFKIESWIQLEPCYNELMVRALHSVVELEIWLQNRSELEAVLAEEMAWRYIRMTCYTEDEEARQRFNYFIEHIEPNVLPFNNKLDEKVLQSPYFCQLEGEAYQNLIRNTRKEAELFRQTNVPLLTKLGTLQQEYGHIAGAMMVTIKGEEMTLAQASDLLQSSDRTMREEVYRKIQERRYHDHPVLDKLLNDLIALRHQVALNAGFANYRDYMFKALGRFDYTPQDCFNFHSSVAESVVPLLRKQLEERRQALGVEKLMPWDLDVDAQSRAPLKPFSNAQELIDLTIECFYKLDPYLGDCLAIMKQMGRLDLESRKGKAPGGYNYPLDESGVPFIFMNATSTLRDMVTMIHEGGHAVHSFLVHDASLVFYKHPPAEVAELASMGMELISMEHWGLFFSNEEDLKRARQEHLEQLVETLCWVATVDKFQHWLYEHPTHTQEDRKKAWAAIYAEFSGSVVDWKGLEHYRDYIWQKQLHIFEVPFYYIEYGIAQLGAIALWKNYKEDPDKTLKSYIEALRLGYKAPVRKIYETAGIRFDFSQAYISELMAFVKEEINKL